VQGKAWMHSTTPTAIRRSLAVTPWSSRPLEYMVNNLHAPYYCVRGDSLVTAIAGTAHRLARLKTQRAFRIHKPANRSLPEHCDLTWALLKKTTLLDFLPIFCNTLTLHCFIATTTLSSSGNARLKAVRGERPASNPNKDTKRRHKANHHTAHFRHAVLSALQHRQLIKQAFRREASSETAVLHPNEPRGTKSLVSYRMYTRSFVNFA
jgi:hypothetical protein